MPLMGVFLVLLPLLLVGAVFEQITIIEMNLPADASATTALAAAARDSTKSADLELSIRDSHYEVRARAVPLQRIPRGAEPDEAALKAALGLVKSSYPAEEEIVIVSQPATRYDELIRVMDIARAAGWPQAALTGLADGGGRT
jgi:biopolymer transport protein ExbD